MIIDILSCFPPRETEGNTRKKGRKEGRKEGEKSKVENQIKEKDDKKEIQNLLLSVFGFSF